MYPNSNDILRNPPEDDKKSFGKLMPTNNQEKWAKKFRKQFGFIEGRNRVPVNMDCRLWGTVDEAVAFLRQEIRQAKIETINNLSEYLEHRPECIRSRYAAGRPTANGYEQLFAGKWYESRPIDKTPKCDCGLDQAISNLKKQ
ncbi:MAG: hypothetical protein WC374_10490 [Phycisphaerae bacterium]|jgi:hypothetical protein